MRSPADPRLFLALLAIALSGLLQACGLWGASGTREGVLPAEREIVAYPWTHDRFRLRIDTSKAPPSCEPLDLVFLFDSTMSMGNVINTVRDSALGIMRSVGELSTNCAFGVANFDDYPEGPDPYHLQQDLTPDQGAIPPALSQIRLRNGHDLPEAYSRALHEIRYLRWRPGARRYIVLFGDAPAHDPDFYGINFGIDRGRDNTEGTDDDLFFRKVVDALVVDKITVLAVHDDRGWFRGKPYLKEAIVGFEYLAAQTGGFAKPVKSANEIPKTIRAALQEAFVPKPALVVPATHSTWVSRSPTKSGDRKRLSYGIDIGIAVPRGTPDGVYRFPLVVRHGACEGEGAVIGHTWITVRKGPLYFPWRWLLVAIVLMGAATFWLAARDKIRTAVPALDWMGFVPLRGLRGLAWLLIVAATVYAAWRWAPGTLPAPPAGPPPQAGLVAVPTRP